MTDLIPVTPPRAAPPSGDLAPKYMVTVIAAIVVAAIYFGRPVLMPLALAVLVAFALAPVVGALRKLRFGGVGSVILSVLFALVLTSAIGVFVGAQFARLVSDLPSYQNNIAQKIDAVRGQAGDGAVARAVGTLRSLADQIITGGEDSSTSFSSGLTIPQTKPVLVEVREPETSPLQILQSIAGPLLEPLAQFVIVLVFVAFILLQKEDLRDRFVRLAGSGDMQRTSVALDDAATRLSRYLLRQTLINSCFGVTIAVGLWLIGIPTAGLWGLVAALGRFVPYVGVPLATAFPLAIAFAVDPGWHMILWVALLFLSLETVIRQMIEPYVYGRSMGLSAAAVVVAAVFWTWLWGPVGLLLSTPLTMCFVVMGRHVEHLKFLDVMLGDRPPLTIEESFYLRMLADDPDEAADDAEIFLKENSLTEYYDSVALKALMLAQGDVSRGQLDLDHELMIRDNIGGLIQNLSSTTNKAAATRLPEDWRGKPVMCVAGRGPLDEAASLLLMDALRKYGIKAQTINSEQVSATHISDLDAGDAKVVCVSYLDVGSYKNTRYLVRRLRKRLPDLPIVVAFWGVSNDDTRYLDSLEASEADVVTTGLQETVECVLQFSRTGVRPQQSADASEHAANVSG